MGFRIGLLISGWGGGDVGPVCEVDVWLTFLDYKKIHICKQVLNS